MPGIYERRRTDRSFIESQAIRFSPEGGLPSTALEEMARRHPEDDTPHTTLRIRASAPHDDAARRMRKQ
jgi:hypothetical protein